MPVSLQNSLSQTEEEQNQRNPNRLCDFCGESTALLYCRADSAKLCLSCDREVHSTNQLFTKHTRWQLCDVCDSSPALIFCVSDRKVLCQNCDFESHKSLKNPLVVHDHRALEGFNGCPSVSELSNFVGCEDFDPKSGNEGKDGGLFSGPEDDDGVSEFLVWDPQAAVSIDDLIVSTEKGHNFQALDATPLPKDRNVTCGKHKQEFLCQLSRLAEAEDYINLEEELLAVNHFFLNEHDCGIEDMHEVCSHATEQVAFIGHEVNSCPWYGNDCDTANDILLSHTPFGAYADESASLAGSDSNEQNASITEPSELPPKIPAQEFTTVDRDSALSRYKEKKRTRRYDKHIRYESRKVLAESRTRINGRFAKIDRPATKSRR
ncbi:hypothetical protein Dimus_016084 [Dionaea muscipula]